METKRTDKDILYKGIRTMGISLLFMFLGPTLFYIATTNKEKPLYIPLLILSIVLCFLAIYIAFKGLQTIMSSIFGPTKNSK